MDFRHPQRLLELEPQLGKHLTAEELRTAARALALPVVRLPAGPTDLHGAAVAHPDVKGPPVGVVLVAGVLTARTRLDDRVSALLLLPGDVAAFDGVDSDALPSRTTWLVNDDDASIVVLDDRFLAACQRWPRLVTGLLARLAVQSRRAKRALAISQLPRVEDRILGLLWAVADTHGHVHPDGVHVEIALTHAAIGELVGSRRPTVSLGLQGLLRDGLVRRSGDEWTLDPQTLERFEGSPTAVRAADDELVVVCDGPPPSALAGAASVRLDEATAALDARLRRVVILVVDDATDRRATTALVARLREDRPARRPRLVVVQLGSTHPGELLLASADESIAGDPSPEAIADLVRVARGRCATESDRTGSTVAESSAHASKAC